MKSIIEIVFLRSYYLYIDFHKTFTRRVYFSLCKKTKKVKLAVFNLSVGTLF